jgi:copper chaperone CopZ
MKIKAIPYMILLILAAAPCFAQAAVTERFDVNGLCGLCETRIEKAARSVDGVAEADWNLETRQLKVVFDASRTDVDRIQKAIAAVGHDTPMHKASDDVYNKLPACCKYDRGNGPGGKSGGDSHDH